MESRKKFSEHINQSFRFRFMLEQLDDLKNNQMKRFQACISDQLSLFGRIKAWSSGPWSRCPLDLDSSPSAAPTDQAGKKEKAMTKEKSTEVPESISRAMNTEIRRAIFSVFASGLDQDEAASGLIRLGLSAKSELEVPIVALFC